MGHPKSHHVSELSPKENQAPRSNISQHVNGEHLKKKNVNGLISKAMQVSWLCPRSWSAWSSVAPEVT